MKSFKLINRQAGLLAAVFALVVSAFLPAMVFAATLTSRTVTLSSSAKSATGVSYQFTFTTGSGTSGAAVVYFCDNSPLIGDVCDTPADFDASGAGVTAGTGVTGAAIANPAANHVTVTGTFTSSSANTFTLTGIDNPSVAGPLYIRVVTFANGGAASTYETSPATLGTPVDQGSFAAAINDSVSVSGSVLESMTFCVAKSVIDANCDLTKVGGTTPANDPPTVKLGNDVNGDGSVIALEPGTAWTDSVYLQLSTNAQHGAVVSMKSNATGCGGLLRAGDLGACDIAPAGTGSNTVDGTDANFGVKLGTAADATLATNTTGTLQAANSNYDTTHYHMRFVDGTDGVTSTYGDQLINTNNAPVSNKNMQLTFAASITNSTPAGSYSADLGLIATGTF